jgi:hypothetical protein
MIRVSGYDVGLSGAAALIEMSEGVDLADGSLFVAGDVRVVDVLDLPVYGKDSAKRILVPELKRWIIANRADIAFVESASPMPSFKDKNTGERRDMGVATMFRYGRAVGAIEATIMCCGVPWRLVTPQSWKKRFALKGPNKEQSRVYAINNFPSSASWLERKKDHQRAESILIAVYGAMVIKAEREAARAA